MPRPAKVKIAPEVAQIMADELLKRFGGIVGSGTTKSETLSVETKASLDQEFKSQVEKYHAENHFWVTFHRNGDEDNVRAVDLVPAGVTYTCVKGIRYLLPQSALNVLKYAVREGLDYGHPVEINGKKYLRKIKEPLHNYTIEPGAVSPEEAAVWRLQQERQLMEAQDLVPIDGGNPMSDMVQVG